MHLSLQWTKTSRIDAFRWTRLKLATDTNVFTHFHKKKSKHHRRQTMSSFCPMHNPENEGLKGILWDGKQKATNHAQSQNVTLRWGFWVKIKNVPVCFRPLSIICSVKPNVGIIAVLEDPNVWCSAYIYFHFSHMVWIGLLAAALLYNQKTESHNGGYWTGSDTGSSFRGVGVGWKGWGVGLRDLFLINLFEWK